MNMPEIPFSPDMMEGLADGEIMLTSEEADTLFQDEEGNRVFPPASLLESEDNNMDIVTGQLPICPQCSDDHHVYCMECGEPYLACSCQVSYADDFFCMACSYEFTWEYSEEELDDLLADVDGSWEEANSIFTAVEENDECDIGDVSGWCRTHKSWDCKDKIAAAGTLTCECSPQKTYVCAPCGVTRDTPNQKWRAYGEPTPLEELTGDPECKCEPEASYYCRTCLVRRTVPGGKWEWLAEHQRKQLADAKAKSEAAKKTTGTTTKKKTCECKPKKYGWCNKCQVNSTTSSSSYGFGYSTGWSKCRHYCETLTLPDGTKINASSMNNTRNEKEPAPDFGLYCDWGWHPSWRNEHIDWPDYGIPRDEFIAAIQIEDAYKRAKAGEIVEVGCIGGHGRTGTALACMVLLADPTMSADAAMKYVRKKYCSETIESAKQEWWIDWFRCFINGMELPEMPKAVASATRSSTSTSSKSTTKKTADTNWPYGGEHGVQAHYDLWAKDKECYSDGAKTKHCQWWETDVVRFLKGDVPKSVTVSESSAPSKDFVTIDGYRIPKPKTGEPTHTPSKKDGCKCDYCRYTVRHGAFLEPKEGPESVLVAQPDGSIMEISVVKDFKQAPPASEALTVGTRSGEYVWTAEGWVWEKLVADKDVDVVAAAAALHEGTTEKAEKLADALRVFNGEEDSVEPLRVLTVMYEHDSMKVRPVHVQHDDCQAGHTACGLMINGDKTPFKTEPLLATTFVREEGKPCGSCRKIIERKLEDWKEESDRQKEILTPVEQLRVMADTEKTFGLFDDDVDDPTIMPDIDRMCRDPEKDLSARQIELMELGLARLNYGSDDPSVTTIKEIREVLWSDYGDVWTWDEVMGAATIDPDGSVEASYPSRPDIDAREQEPECLISVEILRLVILGLNHVLGTHPSTIEIRKVLRESTDEEWAALMQIAFREASGDDNFCLDCGGWADHSSSEHDQFVNDARCTFCDADDHDTEDCKARVDAELLSQEEDDEDRTKWSKKFHQWTKGGPKRGKKVAT